MVQEYLHIIGPGSGRSNLQKKYSMKTTILSGNSGTTSADGASCVQVDVNRSNVPKTSSHKQQRSDTTPLLSNEPEISHLSNGDTQTWNAEYAKPEKTHSHHHHHSSRSSGKKSKQ